MLKNLMVFSVFSLTVLMIFPAYAAVESFSLEKGFYTNEEDLVFVGLEEDGKKSVFIIVRDPSGEYIGMFSDPSSDNDGSFSTIPMKAIMFFGAFITMASGLLFLIMVFIQFVAESDYFSEVAFLVVFIIGSNGIVLIALGILAIYMLRIHKEVQRKPNFIVHRTINLGE